MKAFLAWLAGVPVLLIGAGLAWRFASRLWSLPCPPGMAWALENWYVDAVAHSETILDRLGLGPGMRLLDVGCGPGRVSLPAAVRVGPEGEVVALDLQRPMLDLLREKAAEEGITNLQTLEAGAGEGKLQAGDFDCSVLAFTLGEIPNREAALGEILQALRPGGTLSVVEVLPDPHYQSRKTVRRLAEQVGFQHARTYQDRLGFMMNFIRPPA